jgi:hypothetical protein
MGQKRFWVQSVKNIGLGIDRGKVLTGILPMCFGSFRLLTMSRFAQRHLHLLAFTVPHELHRYLVTRFVSKQAVDKGMGFIKRYATNAGDDVTRL